MDAMQMALPLTYDVPAYLDTSLPNPANTWTLLNPDTEARGAEAFSQKVDRVFGRGQGPGWGGFSPQDGALATRENALRHNEYVRRMQAATTPLERAIIYARNHPFGGLVGAACSWLLRREKIALDTPGLRDVLYSEFSGKKGGEIVCATR